MDALNIRTSIINHFFNSIDKFTISDRSTFNEITYKYETSEIRHNLSNDTFKFYMFVKAEVEQPVQDYNHYGATTYKKPMEGTVLVCELQNDKFSMISANPDDRWVYLDREIITVPNNSSGMGGLFRQELVDVIKTQLTLVYNKIPLSEEEHFQSMTVTDLILELEECLKVVEITERIKAMGTVVSGANKWRVYFKFKEDLSGDA